MIPRVLIIAGSDSGGGAGIQADLKTVTALGGYAQTALTALTAQDTRAVEAVSDVADDFLRLQIDMAFEDIGVDAIKTGMLGDAATIETVAARLSRLAGDCPIIVDPVMVAKGGARLLDRTALGALKRDLLPQATIITPNVPEAEELTGRTINSLEDMRTAAQMLLSLGPRAVLVKGGHLASPRVHNVLATGETVDDFESERIQTRHTHGTGCTLASAIACELAAGNTLGLAVATAIDYVLTAIREAPGLGKGHGPLLHLNSFAIERAARRQ